MISNYLKSALRNLFKNRVHSFINIAGLSVGMAVALVIGLWVWDEVSYNKNFEHYNHIAQVWQNQTTDGEIYSQVAVPYVMGEELRNSYGDNFRYVTMSSWNMSHILSTGELKVTSSGSFMEPQATEMLSLKMLKGTRSALTDPHSLILSASAAKALFGDAEPLDKLVRIDNRHDVKVTGVYEDLPANSEFNDMKFVAPWKLYIDNNNWKEKYSDPWRNNSFQTFVQIADNVDMEAVSAKIRDVKLYKVSKSEVQYKPQIFLLPMRKWHLYSRFKNGINAGGRIESVWLFGIIGFFVLLLACINFMNLSTARSEKRAREVGVRKALGSRRAQLIQQFVIESLLATFLSFAGGVFLAGLLLPVSNSVTGKNMQILWTNPVFWLSGIILCVLTGLLASSYPALYLSAFRPVKVLKGTFRTGVWGSLPRKVLVVLQFSVSAALIISTVVVLRQIEYSKQRPVGYNRDALLIVPVVTEEIHKHFDAVSNELKASGAIADMAEASGATTYIDEFDSGFDWPGRSPSQNANLGAVFVSSGFGKTVGWHIKEGSDFSGNPGADTNALVLNETAVKYMGLKEPVGKVIHWDGRAYNLIGVVNNMVMQSPYQSVEPTVFVMDGNPQPIVHIRLNPTAPPEKSMAGIAAVFKKYNPAQPFSYRFINEEFARKFSEEERIGKLGGFFTILAIFISCLGLFGIASFMAEQRTRELGIRKVLGASVFSLWQLLSKDFVVLVSVALLIAIPVTHYFMAQWLARYHYHTEMSWWIFGLTALSVLLITLLTVSVQTLKAAWMNPVKSLKTE